MCICSQEPAFRFNSSTQYHLSIEITAIKRAFSLSVSLQKETIANAMLNFSKL